MLRDFRYLTAHLSCDKITADVKKGDDAVKSASRKTALIVGGSRGIGAATVRAFARAGYFVAFTYRASHEAARALAGETGAYPICADSAREEDVLRAVREARETAGGGIDVLVNNAGISRTGLLTDMTPEEWDALFDVNVRGAFLFSRAVIPDMVRQKKGCIIQVSSVWGMVGASCEVAYSATKGALLAMTKALAKELGPSGITVNAVAPGVIDTDMLADYDDEARAALADDTPLQRLGHPAEVAETILFLAGEGASFITGQVISPNGGFTVV